MRNRAQGWAYAKNSGHDNEELVKMRLENDGAFRNAFLRRIGREGAVVTDITVGGRNEKDVPSVYEHEKTKSKTDLRITFADRSVVNISVKKSGGGQVYLTTIGHFINGFERQFDAVIPEKVKRGIRLFWGSAEDVGDIVRSCGTNKAYELRKHRLTADTLANYDAELHSALLDWFKDNMRDLVLFCFSSGLAERKEDRADLIWYINQLGDEDLDYVCGIKLLADKAQERAEEEVFYGTRGHGTTIQLPFGFVQWHSPRKVTPGSMQFHHKLAQIARLLPEEDRGIWRRDMPGGGS